MGKEYEKQSLALLFHENTKKIKTYEDFDINTQYKIYPNACTLDLNEYYNGDELLEDELFNVILNRESTRSWSDKGIELNDLAKLLRLSCGKRSLKDGEMLTCRTYASAGARYPIEVYPVILKSEKMKLGIYHYNVFENSLELIKKGDFRKKVYEFYNGQPFQSQPPCIIFFSMMFERTMSKYGERGYRFMLIDAGHMGQNLYLVSERLGLGIVELGAGGKNHDEIIDRLIGLNSNYENVFLGFALGYKEKNIK